MYDEFVAHYYYTLFTYLVIPFYAHLELSGRASCEENKKADIDLTIQGAQTQEEIDRLCKQEIDALFDESDDDLMTMPDSPLFNRLREKERFELMTSDTARSKQPKAESSQHQTVVGSMWAVDNMNQGLDIWSIPNDGHYHHHESENKNKMMNMFNQETSEEEYQYATRVENEGQAEIEIDCTEKVHCWTGDRREFSIEKSFDEPPAHICELLKFLDDDDFMDM